MRLRIDLGYDGAAFYGWARQPDTRTVQGTIEGALRKVLHLTGRPGKALDADELEIAQGLRLTVAGRTDTGVHALHQVCHLDIDPAVLQRCVGHMDVPAVLALQRRLQRVLPGDIAIHRVSEAPEGFDARFSALERTYVYRVCDRSRFIDPRMRGFVLSVDDDLDVDAMNRAAAMTIGLHDFGSFAIPNPGGTTIRQVKLARWSVAQAGWLTGMETQRGQVSMDGEADNSVVAKDAAAGITPYVTPYAESGLLCFTIVADAFARNMVRSLVQACLQVGRGKKTVDWFAEKMATPLREGSTGPAQAKGLTLEHVAYPPNEQLAERAQAIRAKRTL